MRALFENIKFIYTKHKVKKLVSYLCSGNECFCVLDYNLKSHGQYVKQIDDEDDTNVDISFIKPIVQIRLVECATHKKNIKEYNEHIKFTISALFNQKGFNVNFI